MKQGVSLCERGKDAATRALWLIVLIYLSVPLFGYQRENSSLSTPKSNPCSLGCSLVLLLFLIPQCDVWIILENFARTPTAIIEISCNGSTEVLILFVVVSTL